MHDLGVLGSTKAANAAVNSGYGLVCSRCLWWPFLSGTGDTQSSGLPQQVKPGAAGPQGQRRSVFLGPSHRAHPSTAWCTRPLRKEGPVYFHDSFWPGWNLTTEMVSPWKMAIAACWSEAFVSQREGCGKRARGYTIYSCWYSCNKLCATAASLHRLMLLNVLGSHHCTDLHFPYLRT